MTRESRLRKLEASRTASGIVNEWLDEALTFPSLVAYMQACSRADPPTSPLRELHARINRLAASQPAATRASWLRQTTCDTLVLYDIAKTLQEAAATETAARWHMASNVRLRLAPILELGRTEMDIEERQHQIALWVPMARSVLTELALATEVSMAFERLYFRGRDIRYDDDKRLDEQIRFEATWAAEMLARIAEDPAVADEVTWTQPSKRDISIEVRAMFEMAQFRGLRLLGEDEAAEELWRVMQVDRRSEQPDNGR